jgi:hypothetical protein
MLVLIENLGNRESLTGAQTPILDRLAELGRTGHITTGWKALPLLDFVWKTISKDPFPGTGPLHALSKGVNAQGKTVALVRFVNINKKMEIVEDVPPPKDMKVQVGSFELELKTVGGESFILYAGSENIAGTKIVDGVVNRIEPLEPNAKLTSKALRTFSQIVNEKTGKFPIFSGFGKIKKTPLKVNGNIFCDSQKLNGLIKLLGLKKVNAIETLSKEGGLKLAVFGEKSKTGLETLDKLLLPLVSRSEKETIVVCGTTTETVGLDQPILIVGPGFIPDKIRVFDGSHGEMRYGFEELAKMISKL